MKGITASLLWLGIGLVVLGAWWGARTYLRPPVSVYVWWDPVSVSKFYADSPFAPKHPGFRKVIEWGGQPASVERVEQLYEGQEPLGVTGAVMVDKVLPIPAEILKADEEPIVRDHPGPYRHGLLLFYHDPYHPAYQGRSRLLWNDDDTPKELYKFLKFVSMFGPLVAFLCFLAAVIEALHPGTFFGDEKKEQGS